MIQHNHNFIVIIRSAKERTVNESKQLLTNQAGEENVHTIEEYPFEKALRVCYQKGIDSGKRWLITCDADVLVKQTAVSEMINYAEKLPSNTFQFVGVIWDKLFSQYKDGGLRAYRIKHLPLAIDHVPSNNEAVRPENHVVRKMHKLGYKSRKINLVTGIHDYEQYYRDIYRKAYVHASKHALDVFDLLQKWKTLSQHDNDYKVAIRAVMDGLLHPEKAVIDSRVYAEKSTKALKELELQEKHPFASNQNIEKYVEDVMASLDDYVRPASFKRFRRDASEKGLIKTLKYAIGGCLVNWGIDLKNNNT